MACYLCGSEQSTQHKDQVRGNPNNQIHECAECDLVYQSACEPENLTAFYQEGGCMSNATRSRITCTGYPEEIRAATIIGHFRIAQKWMRHTKIRYHESTKPTP